MCIHACMHVCMRVCMCVYVCFYLSVHVIKNTMSQQGMVCSAVTEIALCSSPSLIQSTNPLATGAAKLDFLELLQQCYLYRPSLYYLGWVKYPLQPEFFVSCNAACL